MEKRLNILRIDGLQERQQRLTFDRQVQQKIVFVVYGNLVGEVESGKEIRTVLEQKNYKSTLSSGKTPAEVFETINDASERSPYKVTVLVFPHLQTTPGLCKLIIYPLLEEEEKCRVIMVKISLSNELPKYAKCLCTLDLTQDTPKWWSQLRKMVGRCAGELRSIVARVHSSERLKQFNHILDRLDLEMSHASLENQIYARALARKQLCVTESTRCSAKVKRRHQCYASSPLLVRKRNEAENSQHGTCGRQHTEIPTWKQTRENLTTENLPYGKDAHVFIINGNSEEEKRLAKKMAKMLQLHRIMCLSRDELQTNEDLMATMLRSIDRSMVTIILNFTQLSGISAIVADHAFLPDELDKKAVVIPLVFSRKERKEETESSGTKERNCATLESDPSNISISCPNNREQEQRDITTPRSPNHVRGTTTLDKTPLEKRRERQLDITTGEGELMEDEDWQKKVLGYIQEVQRRKQLSMAPEQIQAEKCRIQQVVDDLHLVVKTPSYRAKRQLYLACLEKRPDLSRFLSRHKGCSVKSLPTRDSSLSLTDTGSDSIQSEVKEPIQMEDSSSLLTDTGSDSIQSEVKKPIQTEVSIN